MSPTTTPNDVAALASQAQPLPAEDVLRLALNRFGRGVALSSSFGAEDMVLIDMVMKIDATARIFTLDTGRLPQETYNVIDATRDGDRFLVKFPTGAGAELFPEAEGKFFTKVWDIRVTFGKDTNGKVTHLDIVERDLPSRRAKKVP